MTDRPDESDVTGIISKVLSDEEWRIYQRHFDERDFETSDIIDKLCHEIHALRLDLSYANAILDEARRKGDIA
jgi:hypothetical protein